MSQRYLPVLLVILAILWGLSFPAISVGLEYLPPLLFAAFRYDVAAILQALIPIVTALWALVLLGERVSTMGIVGVAVGFVGIGLIVQPDSGNLLDGDTVGRLTILGQIVSVSLGGVLIQRAKPSMDRVAMTGWAMLVGGIVLHALSLAWRERVTTTATEPFALASIVYLGVFSTAIAYIIYFFVLKERGAFEASLVTYLVPIVATIAGVFFLDESIGVGSVVGFVVVFIGFAPMKRHVVEDIVAAAG